MKVLVVHNRYRSLTPSGENSVVDTEIDALRDRGVQVVTYLRSSDEIDEWPVWRKTQLAVLPIYSRRGVADVEKLIDRERPDVLHLHNPFPLVSPAVVRAARRRGVPVAQTVHNHRHSCVKGTYFRDHRICRDCLGKAVPWPAVAHGCYQGSRARSVPMAAAVVAHRGTWQLVDRYIALTPQMTEHLVSVGIDPARIVERPNTVSDPGPADVATGAGVLFAGRLSEEKGVALLVAAWRLHADGARGTLTFVGDGELRGAVDALARERSDVRVLGLQDAAGVAAAMRAAAVVAVPSTWPEPFPRVVAEALAHGRPVLGSELGGLPGIVTPEVGLLVRPDVDGVAAGIARLGELDSPAVRTRARERYVRLYSPDVVHGQLLDIYRGLVAAGAPAGPTTGAADQ